MTVTAHHPQSQPPPPVRHYEAHAAMELAGVHEGDATAAKQSESTAAGANWRFFIQVGMANPEDSMHFYTKNHRTQYYT